MVATGRGVLIDYGFAALMGALAARTLGERIRIERTEDLFLAGLMQDLGMLALDMGQPPIQIQ